MGDIKDLTDRLIRFRDEREWAAFHNPKDLAVALSIEASELLEAFLWKPAEAASVEKVREELADVFAYALLVAHHYGLDVPTIVGEKVERNALKYPVEKSRGTSAKYDEL
jgi:NTP pyrophosphatase (non-canonical NTP hydrolase)